jgi:hypothetical protein
MKQETQFDAEIRVQDNAEKVFKQILPQLKALTFKNYHVVGENLASAIEQNQFFCPRGAVYKAVRRMVVQNRGQLSAQQSLLAVVLTTSEVRLAERKLALELEIHRDNVSMLKRAIVAECTAIDVLEDKVRAVQDVLKLSPNSIATLAEMLPDLCEDINLSEGDTIIMLRRLNTRLDWNLGDSDILCLFGLQTQAQEQPE